MFTRNKHHSCVTKNTPVIWLSRTLKQRVVFSRLVWHRSPGFMNHDHYHPLSHLIMILGIIFIRFIVILDTFQIIMQELALEYHLKGSNPYSQTIEMNNMHSKFCILIVKQNRMVLNFFFNNGDILNKTIIDNTRNKFKF